MRSLTSIRSNSLINANIALHVTPVSSYETFTYSNTNIIDIDGLGWEVDFGGGIAKTSAYRVRLAAEYTDWVSKLAVLPRAEVSLEVLVNSDKFYPHLGRVRS